eukprot:5089060-Prymnesium_polylepis.1
MCIRDRGRGGVLQLQVLGLANHSLGEAGGVAVAEALGRGAVPHLQELYMTINAMGETGGAAVAKALGKGKMPQLRMLVLQIIAMGEAGGLALAAAVGADALPSLTQLWAGRNHLDADTAVPVGWGQPPLGCGGSGLGAPWTRRGRRGLRALQVVVRDRPCGERVGVVQP